MKSFSGWKGTQQDINFLIGITMESVENHYPELKAKEIRALLCASLASNIVQSEIHQMMEWQYEQGEDGSPRRNEMTKLMEQYRI